MSQLCTFADVRISLPNDWVDVSDDMPEGTPPTLAKPEGVGALQFSVGRYRSGANPQVNPDDLEALLKEFADTRSLGVAADVERVPVVLRELGKKYGVTRSTLGFFIADLASENCLEATQAVWTWDVSQTGKGMSDEQLEAELNSLGVRFGPR